jgi:hypothetical protein
LAGEYFTFFLTTKAYIELVEMSQRYIKEKTFKRLPMSQPASSLTKLPTVVTIEIMKFTWDEAKRLSNIEKHGIDFADVPPMFDGDVFSIEDQRFDYGKRDTSLLDSCDFA